jgi:CspA family cold shock protein
MSVGTVKWFNPSKGFGFIEPTEGGKDVFIHISALERAGIGSRSEGQKIQYEIFTGSNGKSSAESVKLVD